MRRDATQNRKPTPRLANYFLVQRSTIRHPTGARHRFFRHDQDEQGAKLKATAPSAGCSGAGSVNVASFVLCGCPIVAKTAIPTSGAARIADIAIRFWDHMALSRDQKKLFPHFGEAGTAVFAVKEVEYGGHDRNPVV
jgi:hypothetical protein